MNGHRGRYSIPEQEALSILARLLAQSALRTTLLSNRVSDTQRHHHLIVISEEWSIVIMVLDAQ